MWIRKTTLVAADAGRAGEQRRRRNFFSSSQYLSVIQTSLANISTTNKFIKCDEESWGKMLMIFFFLSDPFRFLVGREKIKTITLVFWNYFCFVSSTTRENCSWRLSLKKIPSCQILFSRLWTFTDAITHEITSKTIYQQINFFYFLIKRFPFVLLLLLLVVPAREHNRDFWFINPAKDSRIKWLIRKLEKGLKGMERRRRCNHRSGRTGRSMQLTTRGLSERDY